MASSQVDEQSIWSPEGRCASGLLAANVLAVVWCGAGWMETFHVPVKVSLCVLPRERLINAYAAVQFQYTIAGYVSHRYWRKDHEWVFTCLYWLEERPDSLSGSVLWSTRLPLLGLLW
jgi:hypothetical protein